MIGVIFFGILGAVLVLVPVLDRRSARGLPSPWWNRLAVIALIGALILTLLALRPPPGTGAAP